MPNLKDIDMYKIYLNWRNNSNILECFVKSTPFVSLKHYTDFKLEEISMPPSIYKVHDEILDITSKYDLNSTLFILDTNEMSIAKIGFLLEINNIKPILTFNFMFHPYGAIGSKNFINDLVYFGQKLNINKVKGYIFLLDNERYSDKEDIHLNENTFNNQYEITEEDLPTTEFLKEIKYTSCVYIYSNEIKEDINCYLEYLNNNGIKITKYKIGD